MAANLRLLLNLTDKDTATLQRDYQRSGQPLKFSVLPELSKLLQSLPSGNLRGNCQVEKFALTNKATGTITLASVQAADTVTINGVVFTAVNGSPTGNQFDMSLASDTLVAADLVRSINASATALIPNYVVASSAAAVVTLTSAFLGLPGNLTTLASSNGSRLAVSGARLTGGTADSSAITYSF